MHAENNLRANLAAEPLTKLAAIAVAKTKTNLSHIPLTARADPIVRQYRVTSMHSLNGTTEKQYCIIFVFRLHKFGSLPRSLLFTQRCLLIRSTNAG